MTVPLHNEYDLAAAVVDGLDVLAGLYKQVSESYIWNARL